MKGNILIYFLVLGQIIGACADGDSKNKKKQSDPETEPKSLTEETPKSTEIKEITHSNGTFELMHPGVKLHITFPVSNVKKFSTTEKIMGQECEVFNYSANMKDKVDDNLVYHVSFTYLPKIKSNEAIKLLFENHRDLILKNSKLKLVYDQEILKFDTVGKHINFEQKDAKITTNIQMFFKHGIFYQVIVATDSANKTNKRIKSFMDSFEILE